MNVLLLCNVRSVVQAVFTQQRVCATKVKAKAQSLSKMLMKTMGVTSCLWMRRNGNVFFCNVDEMSR